MTREQAVIALGSNLGDRVATLEAANAELARLGRIVARSRFWETAPVGPPQPDYVNAVTLLESTLAPEALMQALLGIERKFGRERRERWGPRTLDLDLVAYGTRTLEVEGLRLPHPEAANRAFVLAPLCEIAPEWRFPSGHTARELLDRLGTEATFGLRPLE